MWDFLKHVLQEYGLLGFILVYVFGVIAMYLHKHGFIPEHKVKRKSVIKTSDTLKSIADNPDYIDTSTVDFAKKEEGRIVRKRLLGVSNNKIQDEVVSILENHPDGYSSMTFFKKFDKYLILTGGRLCLDKKKLKKDKIVSWVLLIEFIVMLIISMYYIYRENDISAILFLIFAFGIYVLALVIYSLTKAEIKGFEEYTFKFYSK